MVITDLRRATVDGMERASATVAWEDSDRPQREIFFATEPSFAADLEANPNAFLLAAYIPAWIHGERRVRVDGSLCKRLRAGMRAASGLLQYWYGANHVAPEIEAAGGFATPVPADRRGTACTMSGGFDSLATLRANRQQFPLDHELSIRSCFFVYGLDVGGYVDMPGARPHFENVAARLETLGRQADFALIPVHTNLRHLDDRDALFAIWWFGAAIAAVGHAFAPRISTLMIPSGNSIGEQSPQGSHPLLDPNYSSGELNVLHDGFGLSRQEKVALVTDWEITRGVLRSCYAPFRDAEILNCGRCEKCLRTMTALLALGKLAECPTFAHDDLTPAQLSTLRVRPPNIRHGSAQRFLEDMPPILNDHTVEMWRELIEPLRRIGREDLAAAVNGRVCRYDLYRFFQPRKILWLAFRKSRILASRIDDALLGGSLKRLLRAARGGA